MTVYEQTLKQLTDRACPTCNGSGEVTNKSLHTLVPTFLDTKRCITCKGTGIKPKPSTLVQIVEQDGLDREGPGHDEKRIARDVPVGYAELICNYLNNSANPQGLSWFVVQPNDYILREFKP